MLFRDLPIQKKLRRIILLISGIILFVTSVAFFAYEFYVFQRNITQKLSTLGKIISTNSTAALAFDAPKDAYEILQALKAEPNIISASLYDKNGKLFSQYPGGLAADNFPASPGMEGFRFSGSYLEGFQPVVEENRRLGTLYLKSNLEGMYQRFRILGITILSVIVLSLMLVDLLSKVFQKSISRPILALSETAKMISANKDFSVRAVKSGNDELGSLTDSFNDMLQQIQEQNSSLKEFNQKLDKSEKLFRAMIEKGSDMQTLSTPDGKVFYASQSITTILGYENQEFMNSPLPDLVYPEHVSALIKKINAIMQKPGRSFYFQQQMRHKNGTWLWCEGTVTNMLHEPAVAALISNFRDITARKQAEDAIILAEANYREIFDKSSDAIYVHEMETGRVIEVNHRASEITGYTREELLNNDPQEFMTDNPDYGLLHARSYLQKAGAGVPQLFEWLGKNKDGSSSWLEVNLKKATIAGKSGYLHFLGK